MTGSLHFDLGGSAFNSGTVRRQLDNLGVTDWPITIACHFKLDITPAQDVGEWTVFNWYQDGSNWFHLRLDDAAGQVGFMQSSVRIGGSFVHTNTHTAFGAVASGVWIPAVIIIESGQATLVVDGDWANRVVSVAATGTFPSSPAVISWGSWSASYDDGLAGNIYRPAVYDYAWGETEVNLHAAGTAPTSMPSGPVSAPTFMEETDPHPDPTLGSDWDERLDPGADVFYESDEEPVFLQDVDAWESADFFRLRTGGTPFAKTQSGLVVPSQGIILPADPGLAHSSLGVQLFDSGGANIVDSTGSITVEVEDVNSMQWKTVGVIDARAPRTFDIKGNLSRIRLTPAHQTSLTDTVTYQATLINNRN